MNLELYWQEQQKQQQVEKTPIKFFSFLFFGGFPGLGYLPISLTYYLLKA